MASQQQIAAHLDLTPRRVRDLVKNGVLPPSKGPGGYDLDATRTAYIRYLRGVGTGQTHEGEVCDLVAERQRLEVRKLELQVAAAERADRVDDAGWMAVEDHWRLLAGLMVVLRELLDFHVQQVAPELAELAGGNPEAAGQLVDRMVEMINEAYNELAGTTIEAAAFGPDPHEAGEGEGE